MAISDVKHYYWIQYVSLQKKKQFYHLGPIANMTAGMGHEFTLQTFYPKKGKSWVGS